MPVIKIKTEQLNEELIAQLIQECVLENIHSRFFKLEIPCSPVFKTKDGFRFDLKLGNVTGIIIEHGHIFIEEPVDGKLSQTKIITFEGDRFRIVNEDYFYQALLSEIVDVLLDEFGHVKGQEFFDKTNITDLTNVAHMFGQDFKWSTPDAVTVVDADKNFSVSIEADRHFIAVHAGFELDDRKPVFDRISRHDALQAKTVRLIMKDFRNAYEGV